ncbi:hypothetical protein [Meridianimarinicoccus roseus]|uniref:hypothetical protein n=1 Tax=Meridianimarinicoccus roseus TaxID=2072018 RepID=UPI0011B1E391|nr:hypothetical protein [Meridianimarinicoccus roseus]
MIKSGDRNAADRLLVWISQKKFESEVIIGLNIIEAFNLGAFFEFREVRNSINAASHLSDWLLKANFNQADRLFQFRYAYAPPKRAELPESLRRSFSAFNGVPRMFHSHLSHLERWSGMPFCKRWQHEWEWLQATELRSQGDPSYFFHGNRELTGQFDFADRETYVSAYLRTLSFAASEWELPHSIAQQHSRAALTLNRGLAGIAPVERPGWSDGILLGERDPKSVASAIWAAAASSASPGHILAALRAVEVDGTGYAVFEFDVVTGSAAALANPDKPDDCKWSFLANPARYEGGFYSSPDIGFKPKSRRLCGKVITLDVGRSLVDLAQYVHLPSPHADQPRSEIGCVESGMEMLGGGSPIAFWQHWYSDWEPACPHQVSHLVGYKTTVSRDFLEAFCERNFLKSAVWCSVKSGTRQYRYTEFQDREEGFWIDI